MNMLRAVSIAIFSVATLAFVAGCSVARNQETVGQYVDGSAVTAPYCPGKGVPSGLPTHTPTV